MKLASSLIGLLMIGTFAHGKIVTRSVEYKEGAAVLEGYLAYDDSGAAKKPGIMVVHEWMGLNTYAKSRAEQLAKAGYVAFAADIYGKGIHPTDPKEAGKLAGQYKSDRKLYRARLTAGFEELKKQKNVNTDKLAVMGYCFGGTGALELARSGAKLNGAISFHGGLESPAPEDAKNVKAKILVLHGADDPTVSERELKSFEDEMRGGGVDWQLVKYSKAVHGFTNPDNKPDPARPQVAYNADADRRSWVAMTDFFNEVLK